MTKEEIIKKIKDWVATHKYNIKVGENETGGIIYTRDFVSLWELHDFLDSF